MRNIRRRSRIITVRLPEDEFEEFLLLCPSEGVRTISDLARLALSRMREEIAGPAPDAASKLKQTIEGLARDLRKVEELLSTALLQQTPRAEESNLLPTRGDLSGREAENSGRSVAVEVGREA